MGFSIMAHYELLALLKATGGNVSGLLVDAGMRREFSGQFEYALDGASHLLLRPRSTRGNQVLRLPTRIPLGPETLAFLGLYSGDGNKTGAVGIAQRNVELLEAACRGLQKLFGTDVPLAVNLLNDTRYFMRPEHRALVEAAGLRQEDLPSLKATLVPEVLREQLFAEFRSEVSSFPILSSITAHSCTVSPLKGARSPGEDSREYIVNIQKSGWLLPLVLRIIEDVNGSLTSDTPLVEVNGVPVLQWPSAPSELSFCSVDLLEHTQRSPLCRWFTASGEERRYDLHETSPGTLKDRSPRSRLVCHRTAALGPITSYAAGLYLAEGTSDKHVLLHFNESACAGSTVALSFNSSENSSLTVFLNSLQECLGSAGGAISSWKVKVGSQYMYEMQVIGEFFQSPMVRQGPKGQGKSRSCVQAGLVRDWFLKEFSALGGADVHFSHIEYTGAGIARVQVDCSSTPARLLFSLYRIATGDLLPE